MGKRSFTSDPAIADSGHEVGVALRSSKRRATQSAFNTAATSLLSLRAQLPTAMSEGAFPSNKSRFPLQAHRQAKAVKHPITDDEDDNEKHKNVACKKRPCAGLSLTQLALRKPILSIVGTRHFDVPNHRKLPSGRPLPPPPQLPRLLSRKVILSTNNHKDISPAYHRP
jgi:hypothetical protein